MNLIEVKNLVKHYPIYGGVFFREVAKVYALNGASFSLSSGKTLGIVGESGSGKSTLAKTLIRIQEPTSGEFLFNEEDFFAKKGKDLQNSRKDIQMIFQDPYESLDTRQTVLDILTEPFEIHKIGDKKERVQFAKNLLDIVGLPLNALSRFPHEFSGGQRQRIGIARALALNPKMVICDEPVSALDVSVQSQVLNLLLNLQESLNLTYLFIAHDLAVVKHVSDEIIVMYLGYIVEKTSANEIYANPLHPYTQALISAIPEPSTKKNTNRIILQGDIPSPIHPPPGCPFHTRCPYMREKCKEELPILNDLSPNHSVACHFPLS